MTVFRTSLGAHEGEDAAAGVDRLADTAAMFAADDDGVAATVEAVLPELAEIIAAGPIGELSIIASKKGHGKH